MMEYSVPGEGEGDAAEVYTGAGMGGQVVMGIRSSICRAFYAGNYSDPTVSHAAAASYRSSLSAITSEVHQDSKAARRPCAQPHE